MKDKYPEFLISENYLKNTNQDYIISHNLPTGKLLIICDGFAANGGADVASQLIALAIKDYFDKNLNENNIKECFIKSVNQANKALIEYVVNHHYLTGLGASLILAFITKNQLFCQIIGDSKIFLFRNKQVELITAQNISPSQNNSSILGSVSFKAVLPKIITLYQDDVLFLATGSVNKIFTRVELLKYVSIFNFDNLKLNLLNFYRSKSSSVELSLIAIYVNNNNKKPIEAVDEKIKKKKMLIAILVLLLSIAFFLQTYLPIIYNSLIRSDKTENVINSDSLKTETTDHVQ